jgi:hypothetical protein
VALAPEVSSVGFKALSQLDHLQQFLFGGFKEGWELQKKCLLLCAQFLPKLRIFGFNFSKARHRAFSLEIALNIMMEGEVGEFYHDKIIQQPFKIGLECLVVSGDVKIHESCEMPNLRALHVCHLSPAANIFNRFSTIAELGIYKTKTDTLMQVLQIVGRNLSKLAVGQLPQEFSLLKTLQLCPNLKHLQIIVCTFDDSDSVWPDGICSCLEQVVFQMIFEPFPRGFIVKVKILRTFTLNSQLTPLRFYPLRNS